MKKRLLKGALALVISFSTLFSVASCGGGGGGNGTSNGGNSAGGNSSAGETTGMISVAPLSAAELGDGFNADYYKWERDYFLTNAAKKAHKLCIGGMAGAELEYELAGLAAHLLAQTPQLIHRDFQSQNILYRDGTACFIDFQGARVGTGWYDLASLLFDPYVSLSDEDREAFFAFYCEQIGLPESERAAAKKTFFCAAAQRLMQAIGAYFFLSAEMGKPRYRAFALPALASLKQVAARSGTLPNLTMLATELHARENRRMLREIKD